VVFTIVPWYKRGQFRKRLQALYDADAAAAWAEKDEQIRKLNAEKEIKRASIRATSQTKTFEMILNAKMAKKDKEDQADPGEAGAGSGAGVGKV